MTVEDKFLGILSGSPAGSATLCGTRFYPFVAPLQRSLPYCVYTLVSRAPMKAHDQNPLTTRVWVYQFSVYSNTNKLALAGLNSVLAVLVDYHDGEAADGIQAVSIAAERGNWEEETGLYSRSADLEIWEGLT